MNLLTRFRLGPRLGLGFGFLLLLMALLVVLAQFGTRQVGDSADDIVGHAWPAADAIGTINATSRANARRTMELFFAGDAAETTRLRERIAENRKVIDAALERLERLATTAQERAELATIRERRAAYVASFEQVATRLASGQRDEAVRLLKRETLPAIDALQDGIVVMNNAQRERVEAAGQAIDRQADRTTTLLLVVGAAALVCGVAAAWLLARSVTVPIGTALQVARRVAEGDLGSHIEVRGHDETAELLAALQTMNDSLVRIVTQVRSGAESIATGSAQIATGNADLSQRTEEQASSLQQTAASMEQLNAGVKASAETARAARQIAGAASTAAGHGGAVVERVVTTMREIAAGSQRVGDIIGVVDGIAFQTNILALNAAVEAARAGEQGRGFAVVAGEVRALAQRSAEAAREIKTLIGASIERIEAGGELVGSAGNAMRDIVAQVQRVTDLMGEIDAAAGEQAGGIGQINDAVTQLDQVTQSNAALVEESAAAAESLRQQSARLVDAVGAFRLAARPA